ncbi:MAG: hypothetical protein GX786_08900, partial [Clostridiales bacterium]|nr:hypothetical protein [Clostridiales bacterium]
SNTEEVGYKINAGKILAMYKTEDVFNGLILGKTLRDEFENTYGAPLKTVENPEDVGITQEGTMKHEYPWGYAVSQLLDGRRVISKIYITTDEIKAPKNTSVGMTFDQVTEKFRDLGQLANDKGDRGIYNDDNGWAEIRQGESQEDLQVLEYAVYTVDGTTWLLHYYGKNDKIVAISHHFKVE